MLVVLIAATVEVLSVEKQFQWIEPLQVMMIAHNEEACWMVLVHFHSLHTCGNRALMVIALAPEVVDMDMQKQDTFPGEERIAVHMDRWIVEIEERIAAHMDR
jgi:hypothetical protein